LSAKEALYRELSQKNYTKEKKSKTEIRNAILTNDFKDVLTQKNSTQV